jgi:hypothetical protein
MGSGVKSVPMRTLLSGIQQVFDIAQVANLQVATKIVPLSEIANTWDTAPFQPRLVYTLY